MSYSEIRIALAVTNSLNLHPSQEPDAARAEYAALLAKATAGDREAMEHLLMRAQEVAFRFSLLVCGHPEDAEDVMQDALLQTYRYVQGIREPQAFRTWLYRTVRNACLMKRRKRVGEPRRLVSLERGEGHDETPVDVQDPGLDPEGLAENAALGDRLRAALQALPPNHRVVVVLREIEGLSTREVAKILEISEDNVKTRLHRARLLLRDQLEAT